MLPIADAHPAATTDEQRHVLHELVLQNTSGAPIDLARIEISDPDRHAVLATYEGDALARVLVTADPTRPRTLAPGGDAIAFFDVVLARGCHRPDRLAHRITVEQGGTASTVRGPTVAVADDHFGSIAPPLRGDQLLDLNGCCDGAHRRALIGLNGGLFLAQRFAIDFVRIDGESTFAGDPTKNESYFLFGADVLAVGPGRIVATSDGMAENVPTEPLPPADVQTAAGNHVVERLDDGRFALYAHLQTGSVRVRPGDRVQRGHVLGLVGNTGNSTEPHLHFHLMNGPAPLGADGLPYTFDRFELQATVDVSGEAPVIVPTPPPQRRHARLPMNLDIVAFPER